MSIFISYGSVISLSTIEESSLFAYTDGFIKNSLRLINLSENLNFNKVNF